MGGGGYSKSIHLISDRLKRARARTKRGGGTVRVFT